MTEIAALGLSVSSSGVVVATDRLKDFERAGQKAESVSGSLARAATRLAGVMATAFGVSALVGYADAWSDMQSRVGASIKNMEAAPAMMQRIVDIANASYSPLQQTVEIYGRNVSVLRDLGRNANEAADFTEALNHALVTTATKGQDADVVLNALSRSISTGKLRAMEYETIMSRSPRVLEAVAEEMGTTVTGLRALAMQGKVTGKVITDALINSLEKLRKEAGEMPATIGDAFTRIRTNITALVGTLDQAWGVSGRVAEQLLGMADSIRSSADMFLRLGNVVGTLVGPAFDLLSSNMEAVGQVSGIALAALAGFYAPAMISGVWALATAMGTGVAGAIKAVTLAMMANPLGLLIAGLVAAVTAAFMFRDQIKQAIGVDVVGVAKTAGNLLISAFQAAFKATALVWTNWPTIMADVTITAVNVALASLTKLLNESRTQFIQFLSWVSSLPLPGISQLSAGMVGVVANAGEFTAPKFDNPWQGTAKTVADEIGSSFNKDHIGEIASTLGEVWENADGATGAMTGLMDSIGGGGGGGGAGAGTGKESPYAKLVRGAHEFIAAQNLEAQALGMTAEAANRLRYEQDLLNKAANDNIALSPTQRQELMGLASAMAAAEERTRMLTQAANDNAALWSSVQDGVSGMLKAWARGGDILDTIRNKLLDIGDMLIDMAVRNLFQNAFSGGGGFGGGGGGLLGGMIIPGILHSGGVAGSDGYGHGRALAPSAWDNAPRYHNGTMGAGLGPNEIPAILEKGEIVLPANSNFAPQRVQIDVRFSVDGNGNIIPLVRQVSGEEADIRVSRAAPAIVGAATNQANKSAPAAVAKYQQQRGGSDWRTM